MYTYRYATDIAKQKLYLLKNPPAPLPSSQRPPFHFLALILTTPLIEVAVNGAFHLAKCPQCFSTMQKCGTVLFLLQAEWHSTVYIHMHVYTYTFLLIYSSVHRLCTASILGYSE